jgi:hypothetical protein
MAAFSPWRDTGSFRVSALEFGIFRIQGQTFLFVGPWAGEVKEPLPECYRQKQSLVSKCFWWYSQRYKGKYSGKTVWIMAVWRGAQLLNDSQDISGQAAGSGSASAACVFSVPG